MKINEKYYHEIYRTEDFIVYQAGEVGFNGSHVMTTLSGEILGSTVYNDSVQKSYNGSYEKWFQYLKKKAINRLHKIDFMIAELNSEQRCIKTNFKLD